MTAIARLRPEVDPDGSTSDDGVRSWLLGALLVSVAGRAVGPTLIELLVNGRPDPGSPIEPVALARTLATACSLATVALTAAAFFFQTDTRRRPLVPWAWLAYVLAIAVGSIRAGYLPYSTTAVTVAALVGAYRLASPGTSAHRTVLRVLVAITGSGLAMAVLVPGVASYGIDGGWFMRDTRLAGPFSTPNEMGNAAGLTLVLAVAMPHLGHRHRWMIVGGSGLALALTQSYTAWLATAIAVVVVARTRPSTRHTRPVRAAVAFSVLAGFTYVVVREIATSGALATASGRDLIWDYVGEHWRDRVGTGHGVGFWGAAIRDHELPTWAVHAHSQLLNSLFTAGVLGVAALLLALAVTAAVARRRGTTAAAAALGILAFELVRSYSEVPFELAFGGFNLFVVLALILLVEERTAGGGPDAPERPRPIR